MTPSKESALTPAQTANFKVLRWVVFSVAVAIFSYLLWRQVPPGGRIGNVLDGSSLSGWSGTGRAVVLALSVLAGLVFLWFASTSIAKTLVRQVK